MSAGHGDCLRGAMVKLAISILQDQGGVPAHAAALRRQVCSACCTVNKWEQRKSLVLHTCRTSLFSSASTRVSISTRYEALPACTGWLRHI